MGIFRNNADLSDRSYASRGHLHLQDVVDPAFLTHCREFTSRMQKLDGFTFKDKKQQYLLEFPDDFDLDRDLLDPIAALTGLAREPLTICERHIKAYSDLAEPRPAPHKDRLASEVAIAIPMEVPEDSRLMLFPTADHDINHHDSTADWRASLSDPEMPKRILEEHVPLLIDARPGDVAMFPGSAIWHERLNPANTTILYIKMNSLGLDPLGEDPRTIAGTRQSAKI